jgi:hypothetical protein
MSTPDLSATGNFGTETNIFDFRVNQAFLNNDPDYSRRAVRAC